jgi:hypothetical protein
MCKKRFTFLVVLVASGLVAVGPAWSASIKTISADQEQVGNPAGGAFDSDPQTKWAAQGKGR